VVPEQASGWPRLRVRVDATHTSPTVVLSRQEKTSDNLPVQSGNAAPMSPQLSLNRAQLAIGRVFGVDLAITIAASPLPSRAPAASSPLLTKIRAIGCSGQSHRRPLLSHRHGDLTPLTLSVPDWHYYVSYIVWARDKISATSGTASEIQSRFLFGQAVSAEKLEDAVENSVRNAPRYLSSYWCSF